MGIGALLERQFRNAAQTGKWRSKIVRDIVQRSLQCLDQGIDPLEHLVEGCHKVSELAGRARGLEPLIRPPRGDDFSNRTAQLPHRTQRPAGEESSAARRHEKHRPYGRRAYPLEMAHHQAAITITARNLNVVAVEQDRL